MLNPKQNRRSGDEANAENPDEYCYREKTLGVL
jgi:hypothetical protein